MLRGLVTVAGGALFCAGVACSGGGGGSTGGASLTTSAPPSKEVAQLTPDEAKQYCQELSAFLAGAVGAAEHKSACLREATQTLRGLTNEAELRSKCQGEYQACLNRPPQGQSSVSVGQCEKTSPACKATVAEVNRCIEDYAALLNRAGSVVDSVCGLIQSDGGGLPKVDETQPASCSTIQSRCSSVGN